MKKLFYFTFSICILIACSNNKNDNSQSVNDKNNSKETSFVYNYDSSSTEVKWTAFKHAGKIPVGGKFDSFTIRGFEPSNKIPEALTNISFTIKTSSTNTQDKDRDMKIIANFFGNMQTSSDIEGKILEIEGTESGSGTVLIDMNGVGNPIGFEWKVNENDQFILTANLNVLDWGLDHALGVLNNVCLEKHTGKDGINKLWPDVEVTIFTSLKKEPLS